MLSTLTCQHILDLEQRRQQALVAVDLATLDALFDDDLVHVHSVGLVHGKTELLAHIAQKRGFAAIERGELKLLGNDELAVLSGPIINHLRNRDGEITLMHGFVTQVLRRTAQGWRFTHFQLTLTR